MTDRFEGYNAGLDSPASGAFAITPNDDADLDVSTRAIYIGGSGNLKVTMVNGDVVTFTGLIAGQDYGRRIKRVWATGTSATGLIGLI